MWILWIGGTLIILLNSKSYVIAPLVDELPDHPVVLVGPLLLEPEVALVGREDGVREVEGRGDLVEHGEDESGGLDDVAHAVLLQDGPRGVLQAAALTSFSILSVREINQALYLDGGDRHLPPPEPPGDVREEAVLDDKPQDGGPRGRLQTGGPLPAPDLTRLGLVIDAVAASA